MKRSFYEMLEVSRKASREQIDEAYARVTEKLGAIESVRGTAESLSQLSMIREGYNILSNPEKRAMYDAEL
jgi:molecular chaperone DnaJ